MTSPIDTLRVRPSRIQPDRARSRWSSGQAFSLLSAQWVRIGAAGLLLMAMLVASLPNANAAGDENDLEAEFDIVRANLQRIVPNIDVTSIRATPLSGIYELISDGQIYYLDKTAEYLLDGSLIDLQKRQNLTEDRLGSLHVGMINQIDESDMLIYEPDEPSTRSITVFTDISCGYCRRLHSELDDLLDAGVRVRYLLFPRAGLGSQAHADLESVWCAENPQEAMTDAKAGERIVPAECGNPIESHVALAEQVGLRGTPLIYLDNGQRVPGYREAAVLAELINTSEPVEQ